MTINTNLATRDGCLESKPAKKRGGGGGRGKEATPQQRVFGGFSGQEGEKGEKRSERGKM